MKDTKLIRKIQEGKIQQISTFGSEPSIIYLKNGKEKESSLITNNTIDCFDETKAFLEKLEVPFQIEWCNEEKDNFYITF